MNSDQNGADGARAPHGIHSKTSQLQAISTPRRNFTRSQESLTFSLPSAGTVILGLIALGTFVGCTRTQSAPPDEQQVAEAAGVPFPDNVAKPSSVDPKPLLPLASEAAARVPDAAIKAELPDPPSAELTNAEKSNATPASEAPSPATAVQESVSTPRPNESIDTTLALITGPVSKGPALPETWSTAGIGTSDWFTKGPAAKRSANVLAIRQMIYAARAKDVVDFASMGKAVDAVRKLAGDDPNMTLLYGLALWEGDHLKEATEQIDGLHKRLKKGHPAPAQALAILHLEQSKFTLCTEALTDLSRIVSPGGGDWAKDETAVPLAGWMGRATALLASRQAETQSGNADAQELPPWAAGLSPRQQETFQEQRNWCHSELIRLRDLLAKLSAAEPENRAAELMQVQEQIAEVDAEAKKTKEAATILQQKQLAELANKEQTLATYQREMGENLGKHQQAMTNAGQEQQDWQRLSRSGPAKSGTKDEKVSREVPYVDSKGNRGTKTFYETKKVRVSTDKDKKDHQNALASAQRNYNQQISVANSLTVRNAELQKLSVRMDGAITVDKKAIKTAEREAERELEKLEQQRKNLDASTKLVAEKSSLLKIAERETASTAHYVSFRPADEIDAVLKSLGIASIKKSAP